MTASGATRRPAREGAEFIITRYRRDNAKLRTRLLKTIRRAGLNAWPKLFQYLRSTRQTELEESFPTHVVCVWMGHSRPVAQKHYLQVTDDHFSKAVQNPVQQAVAASRGGGEFSVEDELVRLAAVNQVAEAGLEPARW